ncbi:MAG: hypothetical protein HC929_16175 [Leptolyngbyaceae cyanobacterium SM2_5_2]|nr:hypothetical protein [Leptolyngbyaceae cyanobacterium SM2_5_2]
MPVAEPLPLSTIAAGAGLLSVAAIAVSIANPSMLKSAVLSGDHRLSD